ncbi:MAG TPA: hypothetical protein VD995_19035 [Azospirillum sp.]|nr:hypothetical protein [Azospirillum sp.]
MILLMNVLVTEKGLTYYERGLLPRHSRPDVLLYSIASLSVIPWTAAHIYLEFDETSDADRDRVVAGIAAMIPDARITLGRLAYQCEWQRAVERLEEIDDDLVWFTCNDDHVFVDSDLEALNAVTGIMRRLAQANAHVCCPFSHWPEQLAFFDQLPTQLVDGRALVAPFRMTDSVQIVTKAILRHWWFAHDYGDQFLPRTDWITGDVRMLEQTLGVLPLRELVRHYDGYSHIGIDIDLCPPLFIPPGFFERAMRIQVKGPRRAGTILLAAGARHHSTVDAGGADLKVQSRNMPLFWRDRIGEIRVEEPEGEEDARAEARAVLRMAGATARQPVAALLRTVLADRLGELITEAEADGVQMAMDASFMHGFRRRGMMLSKWPFAGTGRKGCTLIIDDPGCQAGGAASALLDEPRLRALGPALGGAVGGGGGRSLGPAAQDPHAGRRAGPPPAGGGRRQRSAARAHRRRRAGRLDRRAGRLAHRHHGPASADAGAGSALPARHSGQGTVLPGAGGWRAASLRLSGPAAAAATAPAGDAGEGRSGAVMARRDGRPAPGGAERRLRAAGRLTYAQPVQNAWYSSGTPQKLTDSRSLRVKRMSAPTANRRL